jgi:hypothetical protein
MSITLVEMEVAARDMQVAAEQVRSGFMQCGGSGKKHGAKAIAV